MDEAALDHAQANPPEGTRLCASVFDLVHATHVLQYHQEAGWTWCELPADWLPKAAHRKAASDPHFLKNYARQK